MGWWLSLVVCLSAREVKAAAGQFSLPEVVSASSVSGQFIIQARRSSEAAAPENRATANTNFVRMEPALLAVSCERIKQALGRELGATEPWRGKIYLVLSPGQTSDDTITIASQIFKDGWQYRVSLPEVVERARLVRVMVQVLLLEMANRNAGARSAEVPYWLAEGLAQQVLASTEMEILVPPAWRPVNGLSVASTSLSARKDNPLGQAHKELSTRSPLTFEELSWPTEVLLGEAGAAYRMSAQLFVAELLRLKDGRGCVRATLAELPQHHNWQFAFLQAFHAHFERPLDVEKWWTLHLVHFTGRELGQTWPVRESWERLDQALRSAVEVRAGTNDLPLRTEATLQTILREWNDARQTVTLEGKLRELDLLRLRVARELAGMVAEYHQTLAAYLQAQAKTHAASGKTPAQRRVVEQTLKRLDALDAQRQGLRPAAVPVAAAKSGP